MFGRKSPETKEKVSLWKRATVYGALGAAGFGLISCGNDTQAQGPTSSETSTSQTGPSSENSSTPDISKSSSIDTPSTSQSADTSSSTADSSSTPSSETSSTNSTETGNDTVPTFPAQKDLGQPTGQYERFVDPNLLIKATSPEVVVPSYCAVMEALGNHSLGINGNQTNDVVDKGVEPAINLLLTDNVGVKFRDWLTEIIAANSVGAEGTTQWTLFPHDLGITCDDLRDIKVSSTDTQGNPTAFTATVTFTLGDVKVGFDGTGGASEHETFSDKVPMEWRFVKTKATYGSVSGDTWKMDHITLLDQ